MEVNIFKYKIIELAVNVQILKPKLQFLKIKTKTCSIKT